MNADATIFSVPELFPTHSFAGIWHRGPKRQPIGNALNVGMVPLLTRLSANLGGKLT